MVVTEKVFKYLGNGVFDTVRTNNTQAVQSLIRLMRDPVVGNLPLSAATMDALLATQTGGGELLPGCARRAVLLYVR